MSSNLIDLSWEELTLWKRLWCWEGLGAGGEGDSRGWDGWMASRTRWTWVWVNSGSWWWTGRPGVLQFMGSQGVGHDWATELSWTELNGGWEEKWEEVPGESIHYVVVHCRDSGRQHLFQEGLSVSHPRLHNTLHFFMSLLLRCSVTIWACMWLPQWTVLSLRTQMVPIISESLALSEGDWHRPRA